MDLFISPCPNDTFIFGPWIQNQIHNDTPLSAHFGDIEDLNNKALSYEPDLIKVSARLWPQLRDHYHLLDSGGAMGVGVGPLLIGKDANINIQGKRIGIPGYHTTAHFLFDLAIGSRTEVIKVPMVFHEIEQAILSDHIDAGVIIHENRFTYRDKGLQLLSDLGLHWHHTTGSPLPLGIILLNKKYNLAEAKKIQKLITQSIRYSWSHYPKLDTIVTAHASEMSEDVMRQHIELYVNDYSLNMGTAGHQAMNIMLQYTNI